MAGPGAIARPVGAPGVRPRSASRRSSGAPHEPQTGDEPGDQVDRGRRDVRTLTLFKRAIQRFKVAGAPSFGPWDFLSISISSTTDAEVTSILEQKENKRSEAFDNRRRSPVNNLRPSIRFQDME